MQDVKEKHPPLESLFSSASSVLCSPLPLCSPPAQGWIRTAFLHMGGLCWGTSRVPHTKRGERVWPGLLQPGWHSLACHPHCRVICIQHPLGGSLYLELFAKCLQKTYLYRFNGIYDYWNPGCTSIMHRWQIHSLCVSEERPTFLIVGFPEHFTHSVLSHSSQAAEISTAASALWKALNYYVQTKTYSQMWLY